jgi:hypothetical protein
MNKIDFLHEELSDLKDRVFLIEGSLVKMQRAALGAQPATEAAVPSAVQQLKAEIAALVPDFTHVIAINEIHNDRLCRLVAKLQQLSAV